MRPIDAAFALLLVACGVYAVHAWTRDPRPPMPAGICIDDTRELGSLAPAANRIEIVALFGQLAPGDPDRDPAHASIRFLERALHERGFAHDGSRFTRADVTVRVIGPASMPLDDVGATSFELARALAAGDIVYYNGHSYDGRLKLAPDHGVVILDACWSAQLYAHLAAAPATVIANTERSVTGSVETLIRLLDGDSLVTVNQIASDRARRRSIAGSDDRFPDAERYGVLGRCATRI